MSASGKVQLLLLLWASLALTEVVAQQVKFNYSVQSEVTVENGASGRIRGIRDITDKDFAIGGLFPAHSDDSDGNHCKETRLAIGLDLVEAMLFALDRINSDSELLPNLAIGYDIRDTCFIEQIGLDEAADVTNIDTQRECPEITLPILGLVGAFASRVSITIASLGRLFQVPQISYGSTSPLLSNQREEKYPYFFRTVVPDNIQARAIIALVLHFKWNHISVIYSNNAYGAPGRNEIIGLARSYNICVNLDEGLSDGALNEEYEELANALNASSAETVIGFALDDSMSGLFKAFNNIHNHRHLRWIASDGWSQSYSVLNEYKNIVLGMFGTAPVTPHIENFQDYLSQLTIDNNRRDHWFPDYFSAFANCTLNTTCSKNSKMNEPATCSFAQLCQESESILKNHEFQQSFPVSRTIEAVYAYAHALQDFLNDNCDNPVEWNRDNSSCKGQKRALDGPAMLEYLSNVSFTSNLTGRTVEFNNLGYIASESYDILNFKSIDGAPELQNIGLWRANSNDQSSVGTVELDDNIQFGIDEDGSVISILPTVLCKECVPGQILDPDFSCCGLCSPCKGQKYSNDSTDQECEECGEFMWGNKPTGEDNIGSTHCVPVEEASINFSQSWTIIVIILSLLGLIAVSLVTLIFVIYWNTPVIRSCGREQMILLLIGIFLSYMLAFIYVSPPVLAVCIIQRIGLWFCFSLMFGALMVKIIIVARVFLQKRSLKSIHCGAPKYQVVFTFLVVAAQTVLVLGSVVYTYPAVSRELRLNAQNNDDFPKLAVSCNKDHIIFLVLSLVYESAVITATTILGIISFKYPKNFNEAKHISLCTFALIVIWIAFIPSYFATASLQEFQNATISLAVIMSASAILVCNFGPRLFIIFFNPSKNTKEQITNTATTTSTSQPALVKKLGLLDSLCNFRKNEEKKDSTDDTKL